MNLDKTEAMCCWETERGVKIRLEGKDIKQVKNVVYLDANISENRRVEDKVRCRIQAGANAWRNLEGVMVDRKISRKLKGEGPGFLFQCVVPASIWVTFLTSVQLLKIAFHPFYC